MKIKTTMAILMASSMMLALIGCGEASTEASPASELSVETLAPKDEADTLSSSSSLETSSDANATTSESSAPADASIEVNGKKVSVLDDPQITIDALGPQDSEPTSDASKAIFYSFNNKAIEYTTVKLDGEELPLSIDIKNGDTKTSKGIGIGSTEAEVVAAYGEPTEINNGEDIVSQGASVFMHVATYKLDGYSIVFKYSEDLKVESFWYNNNANNAKYDNY